MRFLDRLQPLALLALRVTLGVIMLAHGSIKVHRHMSEFAGYIASLGLPLWLGYASAFTEFVDGILLITGTFTRLAAVFVFFNMCVATGKVHWQRGPLGAGGYEFALALCTMAFALIFYGAGPISIDAIRGGDSSRSKWKIAALPYTCVHGWDGS